MSETVYHFCTELFSDIEIDPENISICQFTLYKDFVRVEWRDKTYSSGREQYYLNIGHAFFNSLKRELNFATVDRNLYPSAYCDFYYEGWSALYVQYTRTRKINQLFEE